MQIATVEPVETGAPSQWLRLKDVIELTKLSRTTLYAEIAAGRLKSFPVGRARRFTREAVRAWQSIYAESAAS